MTERLWAGKESMMFKLLPLVTVVITITTVVACQGDGGQEPTPTPAIDGVPTATEPPIQTPAVTATSQPTPEAAISPSPAGVACAAGSSSSFLEAQAGADFFVYCPTVLPEGLALQDFAFTPLGGTAPMDAPPPGELDAAFVSGDGKTQVVLYEGHLGASFVSSIVKAAGDEGVSGQPITYGDLDGTLFAPLTSIPGVTLGAFVIVGLPSGVSHVLHTAEIDVATVVAIAEAMTAVAP